MSDELTCSRYQLPCFRYKGRYHRLHRGSGQITVSKELAVILHLKNRDKVLLEYNKSRGEITVSKL